MLILTALQHSSNHLEYPSNCIATYNILATP